MKNNPNMLQKNPFESSILRAMNQDLEAIICFSQRLLPTGLVERQCVCLSEQGWTPTERPVNHCKIQSTEAAAPDLGYPLEAPGDLWKTQGTPLLNPGWLGVECTSRVCESSPNNSSMQPG